MNSQIYDLYQVKLSPILFASHLVSSARYTLSKTAINSFYKVIFTENWFKSLSKSKRLCMILTQRIKESDSLVQKKTKEPPSRISKK